ncbi:hypothetical protein HCU74_00170 [Spongiibacter sp. KMU-166]|uniref:Carotenoid biosynthesis protein n=1 Tax=Spongiibacter thalassae TaxID=2721624 RepID=A0ABX1G9K2_9GAMM|nr:hypothetical protein [Spongiibacter thalassae]NKI15823.1 hypothetical protein [Spongiibacter thalassae]
MSDVLEIPMEPLVLAPVLEAAPEGGMYAYLLFGFLGLIAVLHALYTGFKHKQWIPLLLCFGGVLAVTVEPMYDVLGGIIYRDTFFGFEAFNLNTPGYLFPGYLLWVATMPWLMYEQLKKGMTGMPLYALSIAVFISVMLTDYVGISSGHWQYYGEGPFSHVAGSFSMGPFLVLSGWLLFVLDKKVRGLAKLYYVLLPGVLLNLAFSCISWPIFFTLHSDMPLIGDLVAVAITLSLAVAAVWFVDSDIKDRRAA